MHKVFLHVIMSKLIDKHESFMRRALALADAAKGTTFPNPSVGAVIVKRGAIVGQGATDPCGGPHAEINALRQAGPAARGSTIYITLEPCCHYGRTPPCTDALIKAGIRKAYVAISDANPLVAGKGIRQLNRAGITVDTGLCEQEARRLNEDFFFAIKRRTPWISLKLAMTLDGRIADHSGDSRWITSREARTLVHDLRRRHAGIAIGRATFDKDDPLLTVRHVAGPSPVRFILTSQDDIPARSAIARSAGRVRSVLVVASKRRPGRQVIGSGLEIWRTGAHDRLVSFRRFLKMAFKEGITSIMVEGGAQTASLLLEHGLVNRLYLFYGNSIIGSGLSGMNFSKRLSIARAMSLKNFEIKPIGSNVMVSGLLRE